MTSESQARHETSSRTRRLAYQALFGAPAAYVVASDTLDPENTAFPIDVCFYEFWLDGAKEPVFAAVTDGMSDPPPAGGGHQRHELIQYVAEPDEVVALRLFQTAWLPLFDRFNVGPGDTLSWPKPIDDSRFPVSLVLESVITPHRDFSMKLDGDLVSFLWHVPLTQAEFELKRKLGLDALISRMDKVQLPWLFDEETRPLMA